jgi:hypothetical protein
MGNESIWKLYPNPTTGEVNIDLSWKNIREVDLVVCNILGAEVLRNQYHSGEKIVFNMSGQVPGIFMVKLNSGSQTWVKKLILDKR